MTLSFFNRIKHTITTISTPETYYPFIGVSPISTICAINAILVPAYLSVLIQMQIHPYISHILFAALLVGFNLFNVLAPGTPTSHKARLLLTPLSKLGLSAGFVALYYFLFNGKADALLGHLITALYFWNNYQTSQMLENGASIEEIVATLEHTPAPSEQALVKVPTSPGTTLDTATSSLNNQTHSTPTPLDTTTPIRMDTLHILHVDETPLNKDYDTQNTRHAS